MLCVLEMGTVEGKRHVPAEESEWRNHSRCLGFLVDNACMWGPLVINDLPIASACLFGAHIVDGGR